MSVLGMDYAAARKRVRGLGLFAVAALAAVATGSTTMAAEPTRAGYVDTAQMAVPALTAPVDYIAVSTQFSATSAALSNGYAWVWGYKERGMGGNGAASESDRSPQPVYSLPKVVKVVGASDLGEDYGTFGVLTEDGEVWTWGSNKRGRLGIGETSGVNDFRATPQKVEFPPGERIIDLGSMRATMAALSESGKVYTWGSGQWGQAGNGSTTETNGPLSPYLVIDNVHSMHVGQRIVWVVTRENKVIWWGRSYIGEGGTGKSATNNNPNPEELPALTAFASGCEGPAIAEYDEADACSIRALTSSRQASALLLQDGTVYTFGNRTDSQIGRETTAAGALIPGLIELPQKVERVSAGNYHFTALTENGEVWGWGDNLEWAATGNIRPDGSTGQGTTDAKTPTKLPLQDIIAIGGSRDTSYATRSDSVLIGWGDGRLGAIYGAEKRRQSFTWLELPGIRVGEQ
ncbi:RCC1 domain-containing protein [Leucobacter chromiiresistens]|uniref:Alpha-tubulin suppressor n=1 Tax=Leucobacter chromiiresistens TaxID=1079994 RepID=A0A1H1BDC6_9MICO|nr:hypothetical protein [Leucobacter chromiiresistens]SDQ49912.1 Alpha-tubulin suppressor [Leucobacter chromiiresistens]